MRLPAIMLQVGWVAFGFAADLCWRIAFKRSVNATVVIVFLGYPLKPRHFCREAGYNINLY